MGNEADYIRIDRPVSCRYPRMKAFNHRVCNFDDTASNASFVCHNNLILVSTSFLSLQFPLSGPRIIDPLRSSVKQTKLDSHFVADVNVFDGTVMTPRTPFTKIWRLLNSGTSNWPHGSQLVWTGGHKFSHSLSVEIEVEKYYVV